MIDGLTYYNIVWLMYLWGASMQNRTFIPSLGPCIQTFIASRSLFWSGHRKRLEGGVVPQERAGLGGGTGRGAPAKLGREGEFEGMVVAAARFMRLTLSFRIYVRAPLCQVVCRAAASGGLSRADLNRGLRWSRCGDDSPLELE